MRMLKSPPASFTSVVLTGMESSGKSALFRGLTGRAIGDEANFRGSTVVCRTCRLSDCPCEVVDTPGIRLADDSRSTREALAAAEQADVILLVARATHAEQEIELLLRQLDLSQKRTALAITFRDKAPEEIETLARHYRAALNVPVVLIDARRLDSEGRRAVLDAVGKASELPLKIPLIRAPAIPVINPARTVFERPFWGAALAILAMAAMFALPVYLAFLFASWAQPLVDGLAIAPIKAALAGLPALPAALLVGGYGVITLGWYSFLWAFPVVLLIGVSVALAEESGLKDRITAALDPHMRRIGLSGRDLIPVLSGFGCNVVAVFQSRSCSACTRKSCVSLIAFGSACSYQIGASLSIFGSAGHPGLFAPYLFALFVVGALHTRLWHGALDKQAAQPLTERAFLQAPSFRAVSWRLRSVLKQFLLQAMPVFLGICVAAALLEYFGVIGLLSQAVAPALSLLHLPGETAPGILFSILRKDGLLVLNQDDGAMLKSLSAGRIFLLVWLASSLTACLVTLWTIRRELGWREAAAVATRQVTTSIVSTGLLSLFIR